MTVALIDDQLLGQVLRGATPRSLAAAELYTTGYWYVRLCQAALGADERTRATIDPACVNYVAGQNGSVVRIPANALTDADGNAVKGGIPLSVDGKIIGAIGVSGGSVDQDAQCAKACVDALAAK